MDRLGTGNSTLDAALAGGVLPGAALLVSGEEGAGATEFALAFLRNGLVTKRTSHARFISALRSPARIRSEIALLFEGGIAADAIDVRKVDPEKMRAYPQQALEGLERGDVLIVESANALAPAGDGYSVPPWWRELADGAGEREVVVILLHSPGTLPRAVEASLAEAADGVLQFAWQSSGATRRRVLALLKMRGLAPVLDGGEVPIFEVALSRGPGFSVSRGRSVM